MEICYEFPTDLVSILTVSIILNVILALGVLRASGENSKNKKTLSDVVKSLKKGGEIK